MIYDGNLLADVYSKRITAAMIDNLLDVNYESNTQAKHFIERIDLERTLLLDIKPKANYFCVDDYYHLEDSINVFFNSIDMEVNQQITARLYKCLDEVSILLDDKLVEIINDDNGVGNVKDFLENLIKLIESLTSEKKLEEQYLLETKLKKQKFIEEEIKNLKSYQKGILSVSKNLL